MLEQQFTEIFEVEVRSTGFHIAIGAETEQPKCHRIPNPAAQFRVGEDIAVTGYIIDIISIKPGSCGKLGKADSSQLLTAKYQSGLWPKSSFEAIFVQFYNFSQVKSVAQPHEWQIRQLTELFHLIPPHEPIQKVWILLQAIKSV